MRVHRQAGGERNASEGMAREIPWPLPLSGILSEARTGEVRGELASILENWHSDGASLVMRDGYSLQSATNIQQRFPFNFGASSGYIEITPTAATFNGGLSYARSFPGDVSHTKISNHALMADGAGPIISFNGTAFADAGFTTDTGKSVNDFDGIFSHQDRPYAWDSSELAFYYGDVGGVTGILTRFPLYNLGNIEGNVTLLSAMTINAAHGMNDVLVIMTSEGWLIMYEGLDPGDANDWRLLGRVKVAPPVSKFAVEQFGSDLWILTTRGLVSVRDSLAQGAMALVANVAQPIADDLLVDIQTYGDQPGWQIYARPDGQQVLINVPTATSFKQYSFQIDAPGWSNFDYPARWWHELASRLEFTSAADGSLNRLERGADDAGTDITAIFHTAWVRMPRVSEIAYLIPTITGSSSLSVTVAVLTDHDETPGDIAQAEQTVIIEPDNPGASVTLNEQIDIGASGRVFQLRFSVTGSNLKFENLLAGVV